jgi:phage shock protein A
MNDKVKKLENKVAELEKIILQMQTDMKKLTDTSYKTSTREIINREVQFMQKCYDKSNNLIPEINLT